MARDRQSVEELRQLLRSASESEDEEASNLLMRLANSALLETLSAEGDECHKAAPPSPLHLELDGTGLRYCCNHEPRHCSGRVDG